MHQCRARSDAARQRAQADAHWINSTKLAPASRKLPLLSITQAACTVGALLMLCAAASAQDSSLTASQRLHELFSSEWDYSMEQFPTWASNLGDRRWNDRWTDASLEAIFKRHEHNVSTLAKLTNIDRAALSPTDQLNFDLFRKNYENYNEDFQYRWYLLPLNQLGGVHTVNQLTETLRFDVVKDYEDWLARLK